MKTLLCLALVVASTCLLQASEWTSDYAAAAAQAKAQHKKILLDFTGSDWCPGCIALHRDVFSTKVFNDFAKDYVLVTVDFPQGKELPKAVQKQNVDLQQKYGDVEEFPTLLITDADGKEIGRHLGYSPFLGPERLVTALKEVQ